MNCAAQPFRWCQQEEPEMNPKRSKSRHSRKMPLVHPNAAAIDVGATMHMAAVRADRAPEPVRSFGTFTADLHQLIKKWRRTARAWRLPMLRALPRYGLRKSQQPGRAPRF
jgi:hypothetical protein